MGKKLGEFGGILPELDNVEFRLDNVRCQLSQSKGAINIYWDCSVVQPAQYADRPLQLSCSLTPASEWVVKAYLLAFGASEDDVVPEDDPKELQLFIKQKCVGNIAKANIRIKTDPQYPSKNILEKPQEIEHVGMGELREDRDLPDWAR